MDMGDERYTPQVDEIDAALEDLADMFRRQSLFSKTIKALWVPVDRNKSLRKPEPQTSRNEVLLVESFYALKHHWEKEKAYRRLKQHEFLKQEEEVDLLVSFRNKTRANSQNPLQLNIEMINSEYESISGDACRRHH